MKDNKVYIDWLNDARAMELGLVQSLQGQAKLATGFPKLKARIEEHVEETRKHAELIEGCLKRLEAPVSGLKGVGGVVGAGLQSALTALMSDDLVKASLGGFAAEHLEIASYQALIVSARDLGDTATAEVCEEILEDEVAMAESLKESLPEVVLERLNRK